jgi:hypothetical protein
MVHVKLGRNIRVAESVFQEWLANREVVPAAKVAAVAASPMSTGKRRAFRAKNWKQLRQLEWAEALSREPPIRRTKPRT